MTAGKSTTSVSRSRRPNDGGERLTGRKELQRNRVHAMQRVVARHSLAETVVTGVPAAIGADNLGAAAVGVCVALDRAGQLVVEAGPSAAAMELVFRPIERRVAAATNVRARVFLISVFTRERALGSLVQDDACFVGRELVVVRLHVDHQPFATSTNVRTNEPLAPPSSQGFELSRKAGPAMSM